ncbi:hypothetical protein [Actinotalea sp. JY-7876]|uniref:hypothetical protein n=2 Tax=unclassified Actinotalea TaxID=2638618 RepID=UPI0015F6BDA1|nr:hypothetical protein [Actinotalea sp. JY-7876]
MTHADAARRRVLAARVAYAVLAVVLSVAMAVLLWRAVPTEGDRAAVLAGVAGLAVVLGAVLLAVAVAARRAARAGAAPSAAARAAAAATSVAALVLLAVVVAVAVDGADEPVTAPLAFFAGVPLLLELVLGFASASLPRSTAGVDR